MRKPQSALFLVGPITRYSSRPPTCGPGAPGASPSHQYMAHHRSTPLPYSLSGSQPWDHFQIHPLLAVRVRPVSVSVAPRGGGPLQPALPSVTPPPVLCHAMSGSRRSPADRIGTRTGPGDAATEAGLQAPSGVLRASEQRAPSFLPVGNRVQTARAQQRRQPALPTAPPRHVITRSQLSRVQQ